MRTQVFAFFVCLFSVFTLHAPAATLPITWVGDKDYVTLKDLAKFYNCEMSGPRSRKITLYDKGLNVAFDTESRLVLVNGTLVMLHEPMRLVKGRWVIRAVDARKVIDPTLRPEAYLKDAGCRVIVLDPGHGGKDNGAQGRQGVQEKRVVLDVARRVRTHLVNAGLKVYMTRDGDRFVKLEERCSKAKGWGADLFVSIHLNSAASALPHGTETYVLAAAGYESTAGGRSRATAPGNRFEGPNAALGYAIHRSLTAKIGEGDRGLKRSRFLVLREAPCPAALVECLFVSNPAEEKHILSDAFRESVAQGISEGILNYVKTVKRSVLSTVNERE
ncbi:MAG: N-acetylmuramoyl-L-alanine amidase [bacterium]